MSLTRIATAGVAAAGALGIGALIAALSQAEEKRKELEERANDLAQAYIDAGSNVLSAMSIASRTSDILTGDERKKAKEYADIIGVDLPTAARAMAGDLNALAVVNQIASKAQEENTSIVGENATALERARAAQSATVQENQRQIDAARELNGVVDSANTSFRDQQAVLKGLVEDASSATVQVDDLGNKLFTLPDSTQVLIDAETGDASTDVANFKGDLNSIPKQTVSTVTLVANTAPAYAALDALRRRAEQGITVNVRPGQGRFWE